MHKNKNDGKSYAHFIILHTLYMCTCTQLHVLYHLKPFEDFLPNSWQKCIKCIFPPVKRSTIKRIPKCLRKCYTKLLFHILLWNYNNFSFLLVILPIFFFLLSLKLYFVSKFWMINTQGTSIHQDHQYTFITLFACTCRWKQKMHSLHMYTYMYIC